MLQTPQIFKSDRHNILTDEINNIALSKNDHKRMQSIDLIEIVKERSEKEDLII